MKVLRRLLVVLGISLLAATRVVGAPALGASSPETVIYNSFNLDGGDPYYYIGGWTIVAPGAGLGYKQAGAMPFTPAADVVMTKIRLAIGWVSGPNRVVVSLHEDESGIPGRTVRRFELDRLFNAGECCEAEEIRGIHTPLTGGKTYWISVVAREDTLASWNFNTYGVTGWVAGKDGAQWRPLQSTLAALAVIGR